MYQSPLFSHLIQPDTCVSCRFWMCIQKGSGLGFFFCLFFFNYKVLPFYNDCSGLMVLLFRSGIRSVVVSGAGLSSSPCVTAAPQWWKPCLTSRRKSPVQSIFCGWWIVFIKRSVISWWECEMICLGVMRKKNRTKRGETNGVGGGERGERKRRRETESLLCRWQI